MCQLVTHTFLWPTVGHCFPFLYPLIHELFKYLDELVLKYVIYRYLESVLETP